MKKVEYYCGKDFNQRCGQERTAVQWLLAKVFSAEKLIEELLEEELMNRDLHRIKKIADAIIDWRFQIDEIYGIETEIE